MPSQSGCGVLKSGLGVLKSGRGGLTTFADLTSIEGQVEELEAQLRAAKASSASLDEV